MPHDAIDLSVSKKIGGFEIKAGVRDLLAQRVNFKQFGNATNSAGDNIKYEEVTKSYKPGRNFNMSVTYSF